MFRWKLFLKGYKTLHSVHQLCTETLTNSLYSSSFCCFLNVLICSELLSTFSTASLRTHTQDGSIQFFNVSIMDWRVSIPGIGIRPIPASFQCIEYSWRLLMSATNTQGKSSKSSLPVAGATLLRFDTTASHHVCQVLNRHYEWTHLQLREGCSSFILDLLTEWLYCLFFRNKSLCSKWSHIMLIKMLCIKSTSGVDTRRVLENEYSYGYQSEKNMVSKI